MGNNRNKVMNKNYRQMHKSGLSNTDILRMKMIAAQETKKMEMDAAETAFLCMLAIPLSILVNDYWPKTAKQKVKGENRTKAQKYIDDVISLFDSFQAGAITIAELQDLLWEFARIKNVDGNWIAFKEGEE